MNVFHKFPYTNFHEINFDWLLEHVKRIEDWAAQLTPESIQEDIQNIINQMVADGAFDEIFAEWLTPIQTDLTALTERVVTLEETQETQRDLISYIQTDIDEFETATTNNFNVVNNNISAVSTDLTALSNDYADFKSDTNSTLTNHETRITALENELSTPVNWQTRNFIFGGAEYTFVELLTAVRTGTAKIGDYAPITLTGYADVTHNGYIYVSHFVSDNKAYLTIVLPNYQLNRDKTVFIDSMLYSTCDYLPRRNAAMFSGSGAGLSLMSITQRDGTDYSVMGISVSAVQIIGYPAFSSSDNYLGVQFPFMAHYLNSPFKIILCDDNGTDTFAAYVANGAGGYLTDETDVESTTTFAIAFSVLYGM